MPDARTSYFTFGPDHEHEIAGEAVGDRDIIKITALDPRGVMLALFGREWSSEYIGEEEGQAEIAKWGYKVREVVLTGA